VSWLLSSPTRTPTGELTTEASALVDSPPPSAPAPPALAAAASSLGAAAAAGLPANTVRACWVKSRRRSRCRCKNAARRRSPAPCSATVFALYLALLTACLASTPLGML
jgi:alkanesulfonate monooxygenase SsuD/methylene tetrahydromethanopterin reductase-like flavin-dependent oxidoreductase (luciferase family)